MLLGGGDFASKSANTISKLHIIVLMAQHIANTLSAVLGIFLNPANNLLDHEGIPPISPGHCKYCIKYRKDFFAALNK